MFDTDFQTMCTRDLDFYTAWREATSACNDTVCALYELVIAKYDDAIDEGLNEDVDDQHAVPIHSNCNFLFNLDCAICSCCNFLFNSQSEIVQFHEELHNLGTSADKRPTTQL